MKRPLFITFLLLFALSAAPACTLKEKVAVSKQINKQAARVLIIENR